ncbi:MAG: type II toxin-antitoxin system VapC family toxin [Candidatus Helarchaeota archaeon]
MVIIDTDLIISYLREVQEATNSIFELKKSGNVLKTTVFNVGELYRGAYLSKNVAKSIRGITDILKNFEIIYFSMDDAIAYGQISAELRAKGEPIGIIDELIASIAINQEDTLITRNIRHYEKIPRVKLQNWMS